MSDWWLVPLGFVVGAYGTVVGAGGGFLLVPALLLIYPTARPATITSISLLVVFFNSVAGALAYARERRIDYRSGLMFAAATVPGAVLGAIVVGFIPRALFSGLFGLALLGLALMVIMRPQPTRVTVRPDGPGVVTRVVTDATGRRYAYRYVRWQGLLIALGVGFISSLFGIGGGIIQVPAMVMVLDFPPHIATATSQFVLAFMTASGSGVHLATGELAFGSGLRRALIIAGGVIPGALVGARLSQRLHGPVIIRLLGAGLLVVGLRLLAGFFIED
jgi:uncharacterized protein